MFLLNWEMNPQITPSIQKGQIIKTSSYLRIEVRTSHLESKLQRSKLKWQPISSLCTRSLSLSRTWQPPLQFHSVLQNIRIQRIQQEQLIRSDNTPNLLKVHYYGLLTAEDGGGVDKERIKEAQISGREVTSAHDREFVSLDDGGGACGSFDADPGAGTSGRAFFVRWRVQGEEGSTGTERGRGGGTREGRGGGGDGDMCRRGGVRAAEEGLGRHRRRWSDVILLSEVLEVREEVVVKRGERRERFPTQLFKFGFFLGFSPMTLHKMEGRRKGRNKTIRSFSLVKRNEFRIK